jgi:DNA-binding response OmpR family regulator
MTLAVKCHGKNILRDSGFSSRMDGIANIHMYMDTPLLLIVEDEPISRVILAETLLESGYASITAETGADAWQKIVEYRGRLDAILLDRLLPDMDTLSLLVRIKSDPSLKHVPVIMQTSLSSEEDVADGLRAGAYYYLTKPFPPTTLVAIVRSAVQDRRDYLALQYNLSQTRSILHNLESAEFWFCSQLEARSLATLTAHVAHNPERVVLGLTELMLNAVEHGNLGISYAEKSALIAADAFQVEVENRLQLPAYAGKRARLMINHDQAMLHYTICDEGTGFDWHPFLAMSPTRAFDTHGRGIAMAKLMSFDQLEYCGHGNMVIASINR